MEVMFDYAMDNPLFGAVALGLLFFLGLTLFKKMFKLVLLAIVLNVVYFYYLHDIANDYYTQVEGVADEVMDSVKGLTN